MKRIDRILQKARIRQAAKFIRQGDSVLDIGSSDGVMFDELRGVISEGTGIDPLIKAVTKKDNYILLPGYFPEAVPDNRTYDAITLLAVLEHIPSDKQMDFAIACWKHLNPSGRVIITVPSPRVDDILNVLKFLRLIDGMSLEEHYGFEINQTKKAFHEGLFKKILHETFQLGLNNLFVFEKVG